MLKLTVLSGAGMLALAFATPAHADDQATPPPLMLAKTAVVALDEPDATISVDPVPPPADSAPSPPPDPVPVRVVATPGWKLAAKPPVEHRSARAQPHVPVLRAGPARVISSRPRAVHATRPQRAVKHADSAPQRWYQLGAAQYRSTRADSHGSSPGVATSAAPQPAAGLAAPSRAPVLGVRTICELRLKKCLQFCSRIAVDNAPENNRWIGTCISTRDRYSGLDRLHELLLQRLWTVALDDRKAGSAAQYQCFGAQYQSGACVVEGSAATTSAFGWETVGAQTSRRTPVRRAAAVPSSPARVSTRGRKHVLAAVATHRAPAVKAAVVDRPAGRREVAPKSEAAASGDWLLRSLVVLVAAAMVALLLAAVSELPPAGTAVSGMRTRLASKGLSSSRIDLGRERAAAPARGNGISYRD